MVCLSRHSYGNPAQHNVSSTHQGATSSNGGNFCDHRALLASPDSPAASQIRIQLSRLENVSSSNPSGFRKKLPSSCYVLLLGKSFFVCEGIKETLTFMSKSDVLVFANFSWWKACLLSR